MLCTLDSDSPCRSESIKRLRIGVLPAAAGKRATTVWLRKSDRLIAQYAYLDPVLQWTIFSNGFASILQCFQLHRTMKEAHATDGVYVGFYTGMRILLFRGLAEIFFGILIMDGLCPAERRLCFS